MADERQERLKNALNAYTKKTTASPKAAREALILEGIYTASGELNKNYTTTKAEKR
ncbi:hypothetical protein GTA51_01020 [Desulfovibrio aerotolerans]|uniref:Uncharacterized protein n=1 Tax=Solidesulfovibrio aerotolerans TaxID=295255 RepID=A0A7C9IJ11_9BACT|nr:hypothetical protein [Solidesulfovibrio aerotolerans]MYL81721.1 hypothetical protein [Solidesulfovibrio aerotolerans]